LGPLQTNAYFAVCEETGEAVVIDPAWDGDLIAATARDRGWTITHILITHAHFDHVGGLSALEAHSKAPVFLHHDALPMLAGVAASARRWGLEIRQPEVPEASLADGQVIRVGERHLVALYTPGHAPGHLSFYAEAEGLVFDGDVLFHRSIGRTDLPGGEFATLMRSIREKLFALPDETLILPGHGTSTTVGDERRHNPFLQDL
jgi:glyoxylase-like metal-dependent hydrolase (beta-lactamase superfamily II)